MPTLYVTQPGARLELEAGQLVCVKNNQVLLSVPVARVERVVMVGGSNVTPGVLAFLLDHNVDMLLLKGTGTFRGRLVGPRTGSIHVRREQYRRLEDRDFCLELAKSMVRGKIHNSRTRCMELSKSDEPLSGNAIAKLRTAMDDVASATDMQTVLGLEGRAARWYFAVLRHHLSPPWQYTARARRPPPDPVNAMLSIMYTLLHEQCRSALETVGLDPDGGFYHLPRQGRSSLALDFMEEFRPVIADSVAWGVLNRQMVSPGDFTRYETSGAVRLSATGWRRVAEQYERRLDTGIMVPGRKTRTTYRKLLEVQAHQLVRVIMGEQEHYEPFRSR